MLPGPDHRLVGTGHGLDHLGLLTVPGHDTVVLTVLANDLSQHVRITRIALGARGGQPLAVASGLLGVDGVHRVAGGDQSMDPTATVGFDPDQDRVGFVVVVEVVGDQLMELGQPGHPLGEPSPLQHPALVVLEFDVVMGLGPVITKNST